MIRKIKQVIMKRKGLFKIALLVRWLIKPPFILLFLYLEYLGNFLKREKTIFFYFPDPLYCHFFDSILYKTNFAKDYSTYILFGGERLGFGENREDIKKAEENYKCKYLNHLPTSLLICDMLITPSPSVIEKMLKGKVVNLPHLPNKEIEKISNLFGDKEFIENNSLENRIIKMENHLKTKTETASKKTNERKLKIAILAQTPSLWLGADSLWKAFNEDERCKIDVIQLPFYHPNYDKAKQEEKGDYLLERDIPFRYWYEYSVKEEKPDVVIYLSPYDVLKPEEYQFKNVSKIVKGTVYIHYALEVSGGYIIDYNFRLPIHEKAWKIYVRSEKYKNLFNKYCPSGCSHVVVSGHPKMDQIYNWSSTVVNKKLNEVINHRKVFVWNPHHAIEDNGWSTFIEWQEEILNIFEKRKDIFLLIRPHPLLFKNLIRFEWGEALLTKFNMKLSMLENITLDVSDNYLQAFKVSSALISDASSLLLEYLPTKKPILYLPKINGGGLNEDGEHLVELYYKGVIKQDIIDFVDMVFTNEDPMFEQRINSIERYLYKADGKAGYRIKEDIIRSINS